MTNKTGKPNIICFKAANNVVSNEEDWIVIGQIRKTVGIKGWVRVSLMTDFPDRFEPGEELLLKKQFGEPESVLVREWRPHFTENAVDILIEGIDSCENASSLVNRLVVIHKDDREELDSDDEFYPDELSGMKVLSPKGNYCGEVVRMEAEAPCPYLVVKTNDSGEVMIPFRSNFIGDINKEDRTLKLIEEITYHIPIE